MSDKPDSLLALSSHSIGQYRSCPYSYFANQICKRVRAEEVEPNPRLVFGTAFHKGREVWRSTGDVSAAVAAAATELGVMPLTETTCTVGKLEELLRIYFEYYQDDPTKMTTLMSELPFQLMLGEGVAWRGRMDEAVVDGVTDKVLFLDTKTTGRPANFRAYPNTQLAGYCWAGREMYRERFGGLIIDIVGVLKTKPKRAKNGVDKWLQGASPADVFFRYPITLTDEQLDEWRRDTLDTAEEIKTRIETGKWPRWANCQQYGRECQYTDICCMPEEARIEMLFSDAFVDKPASDM